MAKDTDQRKFNAYVKSKTKYHESIGPLVINNKLVSEDKEMASQLNQYFGSVFSDENTNTIPSPAKLNYRSKFEDMHFTKDMVEKKIKSLKPSHAAGPDGMSSIFLQSFQSSLSLPLALIYNSSLQSGTVPRDWRDAEVTPIHKKGPKGKSENYRPVSVTSVPGRVKESLLKDGIVQHLEENKLINGSQHGFMKGKSCLTNLLEFFDNVTKNIDCENAMDIVYLDFSRAFDKAPLKRLLSKFEAHGISGKVLKWIENWLSDRRQKVVINGQSSDWVKVRSGVPQGSVLGPVAFTIFINDLDHCANDLSIINKFADDTKLGHVVKNEMDKNVLQNTLNKLCKWAEDWGMCFNEKKCTVLHVGKNNNKFDYFMNGVQLSESKQEKDLGIIVSNDLKYSSQCKEAVRRANFNLYQISKAFHYRDKTTFLNLYKSHVRCHLEYAVPAWSPYLQGDIDLLENVQKRAINMISGLDGKNYEERLKELKLPSLQERRIRYDMIQVYKTLHGANSSKILQTVNTKSAHQTRSVACPLNLKKQRCSTAIRQNFFSQRAVDEWNKLPATLKEAQTVGSFKRLFDTHVKMNN